MNKSQSILETINELLDHSYDYHHEGSSDGSIHRYHFKTDKGNNYRVDINHFHDKKTGQHHAFASFEDHDDGDLELNHKERGSAHKVLGTVTNIIKHHANANKNVSSFKFEGDTDHAPVYRMIAKKLASKHTEEKDGEYTHFGVNKKDMK